MSNRINDEVYAILAAHVYNDARGPLNLLDVGGLGWVKLPESVSNMESDPLSNGFSASAYQKGDQIVIAFKGTDFLIGVNNGQTVSDISTDIRLGLGFGSAQLTAAVLFYKEIKATYLNTENPNIEISFTGHSLGAGLASLVSVLVNEPAVVFANAPFAASIANLGIIQGLIDNPLITDPGIRNTMDQLLIRQDNPPTGIPGQPTQTLFRNDVVFNAREANVASHYVSGEVLNKYFADTLFVNGSNTPIQIGNDGAGSVDLHSIVLHAALALEENFRLSTVQLPTLLSHIFDTNLYARNLALDDQDFLTHLLKDQVNLGVNHNNGMLHQFALDALKINGEVALNNSAFNQALIAALIEDYYFMDNGFTQSFYEVSGGGIGFDFNHINSPDRLSDALLLAGLQSVMGSEYAKVNISGVLDYKWYVKTSDGVIEANVTNHQAVFMLGGSTADMLVGGGGNDVLYGGAGNDVLNGGLGNDTLIGGEGVDTYIFNSGDHDTIIDSDRKGWIKYRGLDGSVQYITLAGAFIAATQQGNQWQFTLPSGGVATLSHNSPWKITMPDGSILELGEDFEDGDFGIRLFDDNATQATYDREIRGDLTPLNTTSTDELGNLIVTSTEAPGRADVLYGSAQNDHILGLAGDDHIEDFRGGDDKLDGGAGNDQILAGEGDDILIGGDGQDRLFGHAGDDYLYAQQEISLEDALILNQTQQASGLKGDFLDGGLGDDVLIGDAGNDFLNGSHGHDALIGGGGDDNMYGDGIATNVQAGWSVSRVVTTGQDGNLYEHQFANVDFQSSHEGGNDLMYGGAGDDWMFGGVGNDYLDGGTGNDVLFGEAGSDVLYGGDGDDVLVGDDPANTSGADEGDDWLYGGNGDDRLSGNGGNDHLYGEAGSDTLNGGTGDDYLDGGAGEDYLVGGDGRDTLIGGAGDDQLQGGGGNDILNGGDGDDILYGDDGDDELTGGAGIDYLDGGAGNDTYVFNLGDSPAGPDFLFEGIDDTSGSNRLKFGAGISKDALGLQNAGEGYHLLSYSENDHIAIADGAISQASFADGSVLSWREVVGSSLATALNITVSQAEASLMGGANNDYLRSYGGDAHISGGRGNDTLIGSGGNNRYYYHIGDGTDLIDDIGGQIDYDDQPTPNRVIFGAGITVDDLKLSVAKVNGQDVIKVSVGDDPNDTLLLKRFFQESTLEGKAIDKFEFADGTVWTHEELLLQKGFDIVALQAGALTGTSVVDRMIGSAGDDTLDGGHGNDQITGGTGDDVLIGGEGNDTYYFSLGDGEDAIEDTQGFNRIVFGEGVTKASIQAGQYQGLDGSYYLNIEYGTAGDSVAIKNGLAGSIQEYLFADGSVLTHEELVTAGNLPYLVYGTSNDDNLWGSANDDQLEGGFGNDVIRAQAGNDQLWGGQGNDSLYGGAGDDVLHGGSDNDYLEGGVGKDTYILHRGMGIDTIVDGSTIETSILKLDQGVSVSDLNYRQQGDDLFLYFKSKVDGVIIKDYYSDNQLWQVRDSTDNLLMDLDDLISNAPPEILTIESMREIYLERVKSLYAEVLTNQGYELNSEGKYTKTFIYKSNTEFTTEYRYESLEFKYTNTEEQWAESRPTYFISSEYELISYEQRPLQTVSGVGSSKVGSQLQYIPYGTDQPFGQKYPGGTNIVLGPNGMWITPLGGQLGSSYTVQPANFVTREYRLDTVITVDIIETGLEDDYFLLNGYATIDAGAGDDVIDISPYMDMQINWETNYGQSFYPDTMEPFTDKNLGLFLYGNDGDDQISGGNADDIIIGGNGNDWLDGRGGGDTYFIRFEDEGRDVIFDTGTTERIYIDTYLSRYAAWYYQSLNIPNWTNKFIDYGNTGSPDGLPELPKISPIDYEQLKLLYDAGVLGEQDTVEFGEGINLSNISISWGQIPANGGLWNNASEAITFIGTMDISWGNDNHVRIVMPVMNLHNLPQDDDETTGLYWFLGAGVEKFKFSDGTVLSMLDMLAIAPPMPEFDPFSDSPEGVFFELGMGEKQVSYLWKSWIKGGDGVDAESLTVDRQGNDLVISHVNGVDSLRMLGWYSNNPDAPVLMGAEFSSQHGPVLWKTKYLTLFGDNKVIGDSQNNLLQADMNTPTLLRGEAGDDQLIGGSEDDILDGGTGNDTLNGGEGNDLMYGGVGDDVYYVDSIFDVVYEYEGQGNDTIYSSVTYGIGSFHDEEGNYILFSNVENLVLIGDDDIDAYGGFNSELNTITGNSGNNYINGGGGNDLLQGGLGDDTYYIGWYYGTNIIMDTGGNDTIQFGYGVASQDVKVFRDQQHIYLTHDYVNSLSELLGSPNANYVVMTGGAWHLGGANLKIESVKFDNGTIWTAQDVWKKANTSTAGADWIADNIFMGFPTSNDYLRGLAGDDVIDTYDGNDILDGGDGDDTLGVSFGNSGRKVFFGGEGNDTITDGAQNGLLIGGKGNDLLTTGSGKDIISFNLGDGQDLVNVSTGLDNTLSLGGDISYDSLSFSKSGNNLILNVSGSDSITFKDWYASTNNRSVTNLQVIAEAMTDFDAGGSNTLLDNKVERFNFAGLVNQFDAARAVNSNLTSWSLTNALLSFHLGGSDTVAIGGDLAYQYGLNGNLTGIGLLAAQNVISSTQFGQSAQTLNASSTWQADAVKLG
ncbi:hypothetical protein LG201_04815 [Methylobacillus gramineus]|uniref:calcium-binding protein n=1 Tax=Methylobacillus gramineus TaxID=755169 RepID=UPI001CFF72FE|nr:calcium-binding protein [Methylobacillus gramineus]MCB5184520.1 hypothetical protein [Methylobacillus gramineus]